MAENKSPECPYVVKELSQEEDGLIRKYYSKHQNKFIRVGEMGCLLPALFQDQAEAISTMPLRSTDVFVVAYPRSGTTWTQELVWLLTHDLDFDTAKSVPSGQRTPFLEQSSFGNPSILQNIIETNNHNPEVIQILKLRKKSAVEILADTPAPRNVRTHLPISLLPVGSLDTVKVVYVARDPRDVMVSCYHFYKSNVFFGLDSPWAPYFSHVKEAWAQRHHHNMLFLFYEELSKDLEATARRVAHFLGKQFSDEQYGKLREFLSFESFQKSDAIIPRSLKYFLKPENFIRRGKAGGWRDQLNEDMKVQAERWMEEHLRDTDLCFPQHPL